MGRSSSRGASYKNSRQSRRNINNNQGYSGRWRYNYWKMVSKKEKNQNRRRDRQRKEYIENVFIVIEFVLFVVGLCLLN